MQGMTLVIGHWSLVKKLLGSLSFRHSKKPHKPIFSLSFDYILESKKTDFWQSFLTTCNVASKGLQQVTEI